MIRGGEWWDEQRLMIQGTANDDGTELIFAFVRWENKLVELAVFSLHAGLPHQVYIFLRYIR